MMCIRFSTLLTSAAVLAICAPLFSQTPSATKPKPEDTEIWQPVPAVVTPGATVLRRPPTPSCSSTARTTTSGSPIARQLSRAMDRRRRRPDSEQAGGGNIETKRSFKNYQLHIEWRIPANITGTGQARGNSGVFLASTGPGDDGYELQVLDSYNNKTYVNGMAGSIYKQSIPLVNPGRKPGEWQTYDVVWTAPIFNADGSLKTPAYVTVFFNGVAGPESFRAEGRDPLHRHSRSTRPTTPRPSSSRPTATRASRSASATSGSANFHSAHLCESKTFFLK